MSEEHFAELNEKLNYITQSIEWNQSTNTQSQEALSQRIEQLEQSVANMQHVLTTTLNTLYGTTDPAMIELLQANRANIENKFHEAQAAEELAKQKSKRMKPSGNIQASGAKVEPLLSDKPAPRPRSPSLFKRFKK